MRKRLFFILSAVILALSVTAQDFIQPHEGKITDHTVIAGLPESDGTEKVGMPVPVNTEEYVQPFETASADESYGEWADWQTTDVTKIREFFANYGYNDTQTAVDKGIVKVQRRFSTLDPTLSQLKFVDVFGDVDLIANVTKEEDATTVRFPDQDTGIPNTRGGSYETYHFYNYHSFYSFYEDGIIGLIPWALIDPNRGYYNNYVELVFPGKWGEPVEMGRYIPDQETYGKLKSLISGFGNEGTTWEEAIDVDCRVNLDFPTRKKYTFHKLVAGNDAYLDRCEWKNGTLAVRTIQNTGLKAGGEHDDGTEELKLYTYELNVFETILNLRLVFLADMDNYAISLNLTKEGHEMFSSKIKGEGFISSTQKSATFSTPHSGDVDEWRLYVMSSFKYNNIEFLRAMQGEETKISYAVVDGESVTISCDTLDIVNTLRLVPMNYIDGKMKQAGPFAQIGVERNVPLEGEWEVWGEGKMTDVVAFPYLGYSAAEYQYSELPVMPSAERKVRIERRKDAPGIIRIPDPYKGDYPYKDKMEMMDTDDTFYLVIDTTDPSRVTAKRTLTGTSDGSYFCFDDFSTMNPKYGKCLDKKVQFRDGLTWNTQMSNIRPDSIPQMSLELPGYRDFTVEIIRQSGDLKEVEIENKSENIVSVDMALVSVDTYDQHYPERSCELVMNGSEDLFIHNYPVKKGTTVSVQIADLGQSGARSAGSLPTGRYRVVVVPREADGTPHYGPVSEEVRYIAPWKHIGVAEINDQALVWSPANVGVDMKAEAYEDPHNPGFYMLKDCYKDYAANNTDTEKNLYSEYVASSLYIDARDPNKVNLVADAFFGSLPYRGFNTGVSLNLDPDTNGYNGYHYINTMGNFNNSSDNNEYGKKEGDYIKFDRNSLVTTWDKGGFYYANYLTIKLPHVDDDAVDGVESDADASAPVQWYNLQGVRVDIDNVPSGVYIRRQGNAASKVAVRR